MSQRCLGRLTNESLVFGDRTHHFFTEKRCKRMTEGKLCTKCVNREPITKGKKPGNDDHGSITEEIPMLSHIYGSVWYNLNLHSYGNPSDEDMAKAKKAQEDAKADVTPATVTEKKKRTFKVAAPVQTEAPPVQETAQQIAAVQTPVKAKRQIKKVVQPQVQQTQPLATESTEPPLQDIPCITITVRKIEHNGRKYYLNSAKDKLYAIQPDGGVGKYCGRLDRENERIADFPDSDSER